MPTLNELKYTMYSEQTGRSGLALPELERYWLYDMMGEQSDLALPSLWMKFLAQEGFTQGTLPERLFYYFDDLGHTGTLIEKWYKYAAEKGGWWLPLYGNDVALAIDFANQRTYNGGVQSTPTDLLTYTAPSPKMVYGADGVLRYAPHNLLLQSQTFANAAWVKVNNAAVTENQATAPDGTATADLVQFPEQYSALRTNASPLVSGVYYTYSIWVRVASGARTFHVRDNVSAAIGSFTATTEWARYSISFTATNTTALIAIQDRGASGFVDTYVWGAQLSRGATLFDYLPTTTAARYSIPLDHDPVTLAPLGVLVEEQRTNLLTYSEQFDNAAWTKQEATVSANTSSAPNGTTTADTLVSSTAGGTGYSRCYASVTVTAVPYTYSVYAKAGTANFVYFITSGFDAGADGTTWFNVSTGAVGTTSANHTNASIQSVGNGWYRCDFTFSTVTDLAGLIFIGMAMANNSTSVNRDGTVNVLLWGAQLEAGAFPTSYIPTVASQVTRAADAITLALAAFSYNTVIGTFVANWNTLAPLTNTKGIAYSGDANGRWVYITSSSVRMFDGTNTAIAGNIAADFAYHKTASALDADGIAISMDGAAVGTASFDGSFGSGANLVIGNPSGSALNGHIASLAYWPTRKPNAYLQEVTA